MESFPQIIQVPLSEPQNFKIKHKQDDLIKTTENI